MKNVIYGLVDPRNNQLRYIGKSETGKQRFAEHMKPRSLTKDTHKDRWIKQLVALDMKPDFIVIESFDTPEELFIAEEFWYEYFIALGCNLTNSTKCGKGTRGYVHKQETIQILKERALNRDKTPYQNPHNKKEIKMIDNIEHRNCKKCGLDIKLTEFNKRTTKSGFQTYCKSCHRDAQKDWKEANPSPTLSEVDYNASRLPGAIAGGETSKNPERREQARQQRSKAVQGTCILTSTIIVFESALKAKEAGFQNSNLGQAIKYNKPYKGYTWKFI